MYFPIANLFLMCHLFQYYFSLFLIFYVYNHLSEFHFKMNKFLANAKETLILMNSKNYTLRN